MQLVKKTPAEVPPSPAPTCGAQQSAGSMQRPSAHLSLAAQGSPRPHRASDSSAPSGQSGTPSHRKRRPMQWRAADGHWKNEGPQKPEEAATREIRKYGE